MNIPSKTRNTLADTPTPVDKSADLQKNDSKAPKSGVSAQPPRILQRSTIKPSSVVGVDSKNPQSNPSLAVLEEMRNQLGYMQVPMPPGKAYSSFPSIIKTQMIERRGLELRHAYDYMRHTFSADQRPIAFLGTTQGVIESLHSDKTQESPSYTMVFATPQTFDSPFSTLPLENRGDGLNRYKVLISPNEFGMGYAGIWLQGPH